MLLYLWGVIFMNKDYMVTKSNELIACNYKLNLQEQKIILTLASMVQPHDVEFKKYIFKIKDFMKLLDIDNKASYSRIPKITKELMTKVFEIREGKKIIQLAWLSSAEYEIGTGLIELEFSPKLKPYMLGLKEFYTSYKLENVLSLKSKYSIRLYEVLKSNEFKKQGYIEIELAEFKKILGITEKSYNIYQNIKIRVIEQAQKELKNLTDISFEFEEIKTGRKITSIKFIIHPKNKAKQETAATITESHSNNLIKKVQAICHKHKITEREASYILNDANNNLDLIKQRYEYMLTQKKVNNVVGYMRSIIITYDKAQKNIKIDNFNDFEQRQYTIDDIKKMEDKLSL